MARRRPKPVVDTPPTPPDRAVVRALIVELADMASRGIHGWRSEAHERLCEIDTPSAYRLFFIPHFADPHSRFQYCSPPATVQQIDAWTDQFIDRATMAQRPASNPDEVSELEAARRRRQTEGG